MCLLLILSTFSFKFSIIGSSSILEPIILLNLTSDLVV